MAAGFSTASPPTSLHSKAVVVFFSGDYQEYEDEKKNCLGEEGARPHRLHFKPLKS